MRRVIHCDKFHVKRRTHGILLVKHPCKAKTRDFCSSKRQPVYIYWWSTCSIVPWRPLQWHHIVKRTWFIFSICLVWPFVAGRPQRYRFVFDQLLCFSHGFATSVYWRLFVFAFPLFAGAESISCVIAHRLKIIASSSAIFHCSPQLLSSAARSCP